jgi:hypothetical protein
MDINVANIVIALVVPFVSLFFAQQLAEKSQRRTRLMDAMAMLHRHALELQIIAHRVCSIKHEIVSEEQSPEEIGEIIERAVKASEPMLDLTAMIEYDRVMVALFSDDRSVPLLKAVNVCTNEIAEIVGDAKHDSLLTLSRAVHKLHGSIEEFWNSVKEPAWRRWLQDIQQRGDVLTAEQPTK